MPTNSHQVVSLPPAQMSNGNGAKHAVASSITPTGRRLGAAISVLPLRSVCACSDVINANLVEHRVDARWPLLSLGATMVR